MSSFPSNLDAKQLSTYVAVIVIFVYNNVLHQDIECACNRQKQTLDCWLYVTLPFFILSVLQLWMKKSFSRIWKYICTSQRTGPCTCKTECIQGCRKRFSRFFWLLSYDMFRAIFIGMLWVMSLLIDGDWYVCCYNDQSEKYPQLACKEKNNRTAVEQEIIARLKNKSRVSFSFFINIIPVCVISLLLLTSD